jgi:hypothetical protein
VLKSGRDGLTTLRSATAFGHLTMQRRLAEALQNLQVLRGETRMNSRCRTWYDGLLAERWAISLGDGDIYRQPPTAKSTQRFPEIHPAAVVGNGAFKSRREVHLLHVTSETVSCKRLKPRHRPPRWRFR